MVRRLGRPMAVPILAVAVLAGVACQSPRESPESSQARVSQRARQARAASPAPQPSPAFAGAWYEVVSIPEFQIQGSSKRLAAMVGTRPRLDVEALRSEAGTVALKFVERATPKMKWGAVMTPSQRRVFGAFAADPSMGEWLIVFTDVQVVGGTDPIPLTGYRWPREDVEAYAECGIPSSGLDTCTRLFYATPQMVLFPPALDRGGGRAGRGN